MAKNKVDLGCAQTRGTFQLSGKVTGTLSNSFYQEGDTKNGGSYRRVHFGVEIEEGKIVYLDLFGSNVDTVYFSKTTKGADGKNKTETKPVKWADRFKNSKQLFGEDGYRLIGVTCGCKKVTDSKGKTVNDVKYLSPFDACDEIRNLNDGDSVFLRGNIVYQTYKDQHRVNFEPVQVSLCKDIDFDDVDYKVNAQFTQALVLQSVTGDKEKGEYVVGAKIVNYDNVQDAEFYIKKEFSRLAKTLAKQGKYTHVKVFGRIAVEGDVAPVEEDNEWGLAANPMDRVQSPFTRKLVIEGAYADSVDKTTYSEEVIEHAIEVANGIKNAKSDYGKIDDDEDDWGGKPNMKSNLDDEEDDFDLGI